VNARFRAAVLLAALACAPGTVSAQRGRGAAPPPIDPKNIPNFTLVQSVGCLVEDAPRSWRLTQAIDLVATKDEPASAADLTEAASAQLGTLTFRLVSVLPFKPETLRGGRVLLKGIVNRYPGEDPLLNVTGLHAVSAAGCGG
jgi:hypothetical protein